MSAEPEAGRFPQLCAVADCALLAEFENRIAPDISEQVLDLSWRLQSSAVQGLLETVPGYRSVLVHYDPLLIDFDTLCSHVKRLAHKQAGASRPRRHWRIPVLYGGESGPDLAEVARIHDMGEAEVIRIHSSGLYRVYMMGFSPGWTYLGGLDPRLFTPRLASPRSQVPSGCISIGGQQAMIGGPSMPSGWRLLGRTPTRTFEPDREQPFFISAGDEISFRVVDQTTFEQLEAAASKGEQVMEELPCSASGTET